MLSASSASSSAQLVKTKRSSAATTLHDIAENCDANTSFVLPAPRHWLLHAHGHMWSLRLSGKFGHGCGWRHAARAAGSKASAGKMWYARLGASPRSPTQDVARACNSAQLQHTPKHRENKIKQHLTASVKCFLSSELNRYSAVHKIWLQVQIGSSSGPSMRSRNVSSLSTCPGTCKDISLKK